MAPVLRLVRWEWLKLRHRWLPWILLGIIVATSPIGVWAYAAYHNENVQSFFNTTSPLYSVTVENEEGETVSVEVTCRDVVDGSVEEKLAVLPEEERQPARRGIGRLIESGS